jgi:hypothetical protein
MSDEIKVVYERQSGGNLDVGPVDFWRVGVLFGERVIWLGSTCHGDNLQQFREDETLAKEIVARWNGET